MGIVVSVAVATLLLGGWFIWFSPYAKRQSAQHDVAWAGFTEPDSVGLSRFQRECRKIVADFVTSHGLGLNEHIEGEERYIVATVSGIGATIWIYRDQIDLDTPERTWRWEYWDADCPADTQTWLVEELTALVQRADGAA